MRIAVASDHAGFDLKAIVKDHLAAAARAVVGGQADLGIVMGGSGQGEQIAANKVHGSRAALCHDEFTARLSRQHNNANVLALGARILAPQLALVIVDEWLASEFEGGRHQARIDQLAAIEQEECAHAG
jgi:ribose 5-phosphate isomerase B